MSFLCPRFIDVKTFRMMKMSEERGNMLHGVLLIALFSCAAFYIGDFPWVKSLSFSPMIVGIMLGMLYAVSYTHLAPRSYPASLKTRTAGASELRRAGRHGFIRSIVRQRAKFFSMSMPIPITIFAREK